MLAQNGIMKAVLSIVVVASVFGAFFGASHMGMDSRMTDQMGPCPLMPGVVICNMTPLQHIAAAQTMLTALPQSGGLLALLLLLLASIIAAVVLSTTPRTQPHLILPTFARCGYVPFSPLLEAFSNGILHSRAF